jgi:hypothetical protein
MKELIDNIKALWESQQQLAHQAVQLYQPIVEQYIAENCTDSNQIAYTLDFMFELCFDEQMLTFYRKLCRHLYSFDTEAAIDYVNAYRERWDEEGKRFGNNE